MTEAHSCRPERDELQLVGQWVAPYLFPPAAFLIGALSGLELRSLPGVLLAATVIDALGLFAPLMIAGRWCGGWADEWTQGMPVSPWAVLWSLIVVLNLSIAAIPLAVLNPGMRALLGW